MDAATRVSAFSGVFLTTGMPRLVPAPTDQRWGTSRAGQPAPTNQGVGAEQGGSDGGQTCSGGQHGATGGRLMPDARQQEIYLPVGRDPATYHGYIVNARNATNHEINVHNSRSV